MELLQLLYFCHAAETESFAKTAKEFMVPSASISQTIKRLETEIGAPLFDRSANRVKLNERGRVLYRNAKSALSMLDDAKKKIRDEQISGTIRLLVETNRYIVNEAIRSFHEKYKSIAFVIDHQVNNDREKYDLIISDNVPFRKKYRSHTFLKERILLAVSKDHPLAREKAVDVSRLEHEQFISLPPESGLFTITRRICSCGSFEPCVTLFTSDPYTVINHVAKNLGVAIIPETSWSPLFSDDIVLKHLSNVKAEHLTRPTSIICNTEKYTSKATRLFIEELTDTAKKFDIL